MCRPYGKLEQRLEGGEGLSRWICGGVSRWREQPKQRPEGMFLVHQGIAHRPVWLGQSEQWKVVGRGLGRVAADCIGPGRPR